MAFQLGFTSKLKVPQRKIQNKSMGDINLSGSKGRMGIDNADYSNKKDIGSIKTLKATGIKGESPDICC